MDGKLTSGHGRAVLSVENKSDQLSFATYILNNNLSVRESETLAKKWPINKEEKITNTNIKPKSVEIQKAEELLQRKFQTKVLFSGDDNKGRIQIDYYSTDELERILEILNINL